MLTTRGNVSSLDYYPSEIWITKWLRDLSREKELLRAGEGCTLRASAAGLTAWRVDGLQLGRHKCLCGRSLGLVLTPHFVDILFLQHRWRGVPACFTLLSSLVEKFAWGFGVSRNLGVIHCSLSKPDLGEVSWLYRTPTLVGFRAPRPIWFLLVSSQES